MNFYLLEVFHRYIIFFPTLLVINVIDPYNTFIKTKKNRIECLMKLSEFVDVYLSPKQLSKFKIQYVNSPTNLLKFLACLKI